MLRITSSAYAAMIGHAYDGLPDEACGLMGGRFERGTVEVFVPARNADASSRTYSIGPDGFAAAEAAFDPLGLDVVGVMHSHTHTDAYPSPTDVDKARQPAAGGVALRDRVAAGRRPGAALVPDRRPEDPGGGRRGRRPVES